jgi:site-specific DNA recombinase
LIVRELKERGVDMYFEKENIHSIDNAKEIDIALGAALAQEESRNLSGNALWGFNRKCETGVSSMLIKPVYGFKCENDELIVVSHEAAVIRGIFHLYLEGKTVRQIRNYLEEKKVLAPSGRTTWADTTIRQMLKCEKYKGDVMLQKTYTEDYLTGKRKVNYGQRQRYYVIANHEGIISPEVFHQVQDEMFRRARVVLNEEGEQISTGNRYSSKYLLGNLLKCGNCGASYYRRTERGKIVWRCGTRMEIGKEVCRHSPTLQDNKMKQILGKAICGNFYNESIIKDKVKRIDIYEKRIIICVADTEQYLICHL